MFTTAKKVLLLIIGLLITESSFGASACGPQVGLASSLHGQDLIAWDGAQRGVQGRLNPCAGNFSFVIGASRPMFVYNSQDDSNSFPQLGNGFRYAIPEIRVTGGIPSYTDEYGRGYVLVADAALGANRFRAVDPKELKSQFDLSSLATQNTITQILPGGREMIRFHANANRADYYLPVTQETISAYVVKKWNWINLATTVTQLLAITDSNDSGDNVDQVSNGILITQTGTSNRTKVFTDNGNISKVIYPDGQKLVFSYAGDNLTQIVVNSAYTYTFNHDSEDRVIGGTYPGAYNFGIAYSPTQTVFSDNSSGSMAPRTNLNYSGEVAVSSAQNGIISYTLSVPAAGAPQTYLTSTPSGQTMSVTYNSAGDVQSSTDSAGVQSSMLYDVHHNITRRTVTVGSRAYVTNFGYDSSFRLTSTIDPKGSVTTYSYNTWNQLLTLGFGNGGSISNDYYPASPSMPALQRKRIADRLGRVTTINYMYHSGTNNSRLSLKSITNPQGQMTSTTYDADGKPVLIISPGGIEVAYGYNTFKEVNSVTTSVGGAVANQVTKSYGSNLHSQNMSYTANGVTDTFTAQYSSSTGQLVNQSINGVATVTEGKKLFR